MKDRQDHEKTPSKAEGVFSAVYFLTLADYRFMEKLLLNDNIY